MGQSLLTPKKEGKLPKWVLPYAIGGQAADIGTTGWALSHGFEESNPVLPKGFGKILATKAVMTGAEVWAIKKLEKNHPKIAKGLGILTGSAGLVPSFINLYRMNKKKA